MRKKHILNLTEEEREMLSEVSQAVKMAHKKRLHAQILLKCDEDENGASWTDAKVAEAFEVTERTVQSIRKTAVEEGLEIALQRPRQARPEMRKLDGSAEARLIAESCSKPPEGHAKWTLKLLSERLVALEIVDSISTETVRRTLKKTK